MPWDPPPAPATSTLSAPRPQASSSSSSAAATVFAANGEVHIKREPTGDYEGYHNTHNTAALQRAGQQLQEKFGGAASQQVNALQARAEMAAKREPSVAAPPASAEQQRIYQERLQAQARAKAQQNLQNLQQAQRNASAGNAQTDGAADWADMVAARRAAAAGAQGSEADLSIRQKVEQMASEMEGGGLMRPLSEHRAPPASAHLRAAQKASATVPQLDGNLDDEDEKVKSELDEDAINSDLDDPDDDVIEEAEDDQTSELMLCTYDKVQRVKNKWKCTLKDGVLTTGGKEYV